MITAKRVGTGLWVAGAVLLVVFLDWKLDSVSATTALIAVLSCAALLELLRMLESAGMAVDKVPAVATLAGALVLRAVAPSLELSPHEARELSLAVLAGGALYPVVAGVARSGREPPSLDALRRAAATTFALVYVGLLATFLMELRMLGGGRGAPTGLGLAVLLAACVKVGDSAAYFVGRTIGRIPLCPVSPKKTWEGSVASVIASVATAAAVGHVVLGHDLRAVVGFGLVADLAGQGGDLVESWVKRALGRKDSSEAFGEMGGFLDVADAILVAAPPAFVWAQIVIVRGG